jgi:hypothetical protein
MEVMTIRHKHWFMRIWKCCGHTWELLLSKRYPERWTWTPICPDCNTKGTTH